jgi:hypothetical protein
MAHPGRARPDRRTGQDDEFWLVQVRAPRPQGGRTLGVMNGARANKNSPIFASMSCPETELSFSGKRITLV